MQGGNTGGAGGGGDRNRTDVSRFCRPLPYRLATPPALVDSMARDFTGRDGGVSNPVGRSEKGRPPREPARMLERETGVEPATSTLARLHSTTELFPRTPGSAGREG